MANYANEVFNSRSQFQDKSLRFEFDAKHLFQFYFYVLCHIEALAG